MLNIHGDRYGDCEGTSRRNFLRVGSLGLTGLALPDMLRIRAQAARLGTSSKNTAVIQIVLGGGPTHIDTFDPKPDAPREFKGEFKTIPTALPGVQFTELLPRCAQAMGKMALIRSGHVGAAH